MTTAIPPTVLSEILASKLSAETIVSLLNEAEAKYSSLPKHWNSKRVYPFWKTCQHCSKPFMTHNKEQAVRNRTCGRACAGALVSGANSGTWALEERAGRVVHCAVCGTSVWKPESWLKRVTTPTCSRRCNGRLRGQTLSQYGYMGRRGWKPESERALVERMTGDTNPSWKGGVTYRKRKGLYADQPIKYVRCPEELLGMARRDGYVMQHRLVVAQAVGRSLSRSEVVHHINHDATDNRLENLMLFATNGQHKAFEHGRAISPLWCGWCHSTTPARSGVCVCQPVRSLQSATA